jgi:hypothetical protein
MVQFRFLIMENEKPIAGFKSLFVALSFIASRGVANYKIKEVIGYNTQHEYAPWYTNDGEMEEYLEDIKRAPRNVVGCG